MISVVKQRLQQRAAIAQWNLKNHCNILFSIKCCIIVAILVLQHCCVAKFEQTTILSNPHLTTLDMINLCHLSCLFPSFQKPSYSGDPGALPLPSALNITDGSMKLLNTHPAMPHHHPQNLGRSIFLKRSRYYYGHQYSRRNSANHANASSSRGKGTSSLDDKLSFKLASQPNSSSKQHTGMCMSSMLLNFQSFWQC